MCPALYNPTLESSVQFVALHFNDVTRTCMEQKPCCCGSSTTNILTAWDSSSEHKTTSWKGWFTPNSSSIGKLLVFSLGNSFLPELWIFQTLHTHSSSSIWEAHTVFILLISWGEHDSKRSINSSWNPKVKIKQSTVCTYSENLAII